MGDAQAAEPVRRIPAQSAGARSSRTLTPPRTTLLNRGEPSDVRDRERTLARRLALHDRLRPSALLADRPRHPHLAVPRRGRRRERLTGRLVLDTTAMELAENRGVVPLMAPTRRPSGRSTCGSCGSASPVRWAPSCGTPSA